MLSSNRACTWQPLLRLSSWYPLILGSHYWGYHPGTLSSLAAITGAIILVPSHPWQPLLVLSSWYPLILGSNYQGYHPGTLSSLVSITGAIILVPSHPWQPLPELSSWYPLILGSHYWGYHPGTLSSLASITGAIILVPSHPWHPLLGLSSWYPLILVKSLQHIWRLGTCRFHLQVPNLKMSCSDFIKWSGTSCVAPVLATGWYAQFAVWHDTEGAPHQGALLLIYCTIIRLRLWHG